MNYREDAQDPESVVDTENNKPRDLRGGGGGGTIGSTMDSRLTEALDEDLGAADLADTGPDQSERLGD